MLYSNLDSNNSALLQVHYVQCPPTVTSVNYSILIIDSYQVPYKSQCCKYMFLCSGKIQIIMYI